jgi:hypothetical protein
MERTKAPSVTGVSLALGVERTSELAVTIYCEGSSLAGLNPLHFGSHFDPLWQLLLDLANKPMGDFSKLL